MEIPIQDAHELELISGTDWCRYCGEHRDSEAHEILPRLDQDNRIMWDETECRADDLKQRESQLLSCMGQVRYLTNRVKELEGK